MRLRPFLALVPFVVLTSTVSAAGIDFNRDVRPILSETCFQCHGPDKNHLEADLRLDEGDGLFRERDGMTIVIPGKPEASELIARITSTEDDVRMPPPEAGRALSAEQIEIIRTWIAQGAEWKGHWSWIPPVRPELPPGLADSDFGVIDGFVSEQLAGRNLNPAGPADSRALVRRLSFDLTGLAPAPDAVDAFAADPGGAAYEALIGRLLDSPHFGERMTMSWLDLVRYADTNGIHGDTHRDVALFRDYVIKAFNDNMPFDRFTIEQLAGDLLSEPTIDQRVASGYNRLLMTTREGGAQPKEYLAKYAADRVRNATTVWLGATVGCAECHDHKFDPYSTRDFYSFAAFFADVQEAAVGRQQPTQIPSPPQAAELNRLAGEIARVKSILETQTPELDLALAAWEERKHAELAGSRLAWTAIAPSSAESTGGQTLSVQDDISVLTSGENPAKATYTITLATDAANITGIRLEALTHESFKGLSRGNGNFVLSNFEVDVAAAVNVDERETDDGKPSAAGVPVNIASVQTDYEQSGWPAKNALDGKSDTGWAVDGNKQQTENRTAVFAFEKSVSGGPGTIFAIRIKHESALAGHNIGRFRLSLTAVEKPPLDNYGIGLPPNIVEILTKPVDQRSEEQKQKIAAHFRSIAPQLDGTRVELKQLTAAHEALDKSIPTMLITTAMAPREMRVLPRGNWLDDSGEVVQPAVPHFLKQIETEGRATRLDLAQWLVAPDNPLVARVFVNRLWKLFFGQGLVRSLDDFGSQGAWPTHPELLDWLAVEFIESGWNVKHMIRLMLMSETYRRSSVPTPELRQTDPLNRWLARQARFRLDAEMVRDNALLVSGLLVDRIGGNSVKPYQPAGYWKHLNFPKRAWRNDSDGNQYRRGVYTYWCRTFLHPSLLAFDAPSREECCVDRPRSNNPLQALVLLNDPTYVEAARVCVPSCSVA